MKCAKMNCRQEYNPVIAQELLTELISLDSSWGEQIEQGIFVFKGLCPGCLIEASTSDTEEIMKFMTFYFDNRFLHGLVNEYPKLTALLLNSYVSLIESEEIPIQQDTYERTIDELTKKGWN